MSDEAHPGTDTGAPPTDDGLPHPTPADPLLAGAGFETRAIHAGQPPDPVTGAVVPPVSVATTFAQRAVGEHAGFEYSRSGNPTRAALEACLADLEGAPHGLAFASGLAAEHAVLGLLRPGDHVILPKDAYGGTYRLVDKVHRVHGLEHTPVDLTDLTDAAPLAAAWRPTTRMVWVETPSNPLLGVADIAALATEAHAHGALLVVDNTFATPYLQQPLALGADVAVHSATKYLGGHSDVVGGFVATADDAVAEQLRFLQNATGAVPGPFDCYLVLRGVKTLALRMERHCDNAAAVAAALVASGAVGRVLYPGLPDHPNAEVATRQMRRPGGMVSFVVRGDDPAAREAAARQVARRTTLWTLAESLGAVESLIEVPHLMTHASVADSPLAVDPGLVRLSVGVETVDDLVTDLLDALAGVG
ncbi:MAG TPA: cystathionine gamma-synthase [Acidimicrobiales bacterium]|nr:cystathionine gamma-synthase [Acidimicrobiales bacterium]